VKNYKLVIEYAGTRYSGWQEQKNAVTVAGELRGAIEKVVGPIDDLGGAGRTDAGVHALAQVAHVRFESSIDVLRFQEQVNAQLPSDIHVLQVAEAKPRFHARHAAISRTYTYQISRRRTAFVKKYVWWVQRKLDLERMWAALPAVVGEHDFIRFCDRPQDQRTTHVRMDRAEIAESGSLILLRFEASNFLWRMVRRLTGALVEVGAGKLAVEDFAALVEGAELPPEKGVASEWTAPPSGLFLERVRYEGDPPPPPLAPVFAIG
jgi:tRNA pseudouridine38-40 synthase